MKFNLVDEKFTSDINRDIHFNKHIVIKNEFDYSEEEYEQRAELLAKSNIDNKKIFGYISITKDLAINISKTIVRTKKIKQMGVDFYALGHRI